MSILVNFYLQRVVRGLVELDIDERFIELVSLLHLALHGVET